MALCAGILPAALSGKNFVKPIAQPAKTYPAHDIHSDEKVGIAADPYDTPEKAKLFTMDFQEKSLLPVFFVVTNDSDQPVSIAHIEITLLTANRSKLTPLSSDDIYRRLSNPQARTSPNPFPIPRKSVKTGISKKEMEEIDSSQFAARAVEPHATQSGFLFFDIGGISSPLAGATLDVNGVSDAKGHDLMFFEIPMSQ